MAVISRESNLGISMAKQLFYVKQSSYLVMNFRSFVTFSTSNLQTWPAK